MYKKCIITIVSVTVAKRDKMVRQKAEESCVWLKYKIKLIDPKIIQYTKKPNNNYKAKKLFLTFLKGMCWIYVMSVTFFVTKYTF